MLLLQHGNLKNETDSETEKTTLVCRIDVQVQINVQGEKFFKNIKRAGQNRRAGGTFSGKSINVQGKNL